MNNGLLYRDLRALDEKLADEFDDIYRRSLEIWASPALRTFTEHGEEHSKSVARNLDALTRPLQSLPAPQNPDELIGPLNAHEIFILLSACCLHDTGMQLDDKDAREKHAEYACNIILHSSARIDFDLRRITLPISNDNAREAIALVARAHWTDFALDLEKYDNRIYDNRRGRLPLLGVLLAMADLLDLSPVRANYFRSDDRLFNLDPRGWLHHITHVRVKGCDILPPDQKGELQFEVVWREGEDEEDRRDIRSVSDWIMTWFNSQWGLLNSALYNYSGGAIRWSDPWFNIKFTESLIPLEAEKKRLTPEARSILRAERIDQRRIDRDEFIKKFKTSIENHEAIVFTIPWESDLDGSFICDWCEAHAATVDKCKVARVSIGQTPSTATSLSGVVSDLMLGWQEDWSECNDKQALARLRELLNAKYDTAFVSIIVADGEKKRWLRDLVKALVQRPTKAPAGARLCLLRIPEDVRPRRIDDVNLIHFNAPPFSQQDVEAHLKRRYGYPEAASQEKYERLSRLPNSQKPMMMYDYIETIYGLPLSGE